MRFCWVMHTTGLHSLNRLRRSQSGVVAILGAVWLIVAVICLMAVDIGNLFWQRRELQKVADLSALAGAQSLTLGCSAVQTSVTQIAAANGWKTADSVPVLEYGKWDPGQGPVDATVSPPTYFRPAANCANPGMALNAVRVSVMRTVPYFFVFNWQSAGRQISASATASVSGQMASFWVGSRLASVGGASILGSLLKGIGLNLSGTTVSGYDGLAQVKVTPAGLLSALGIPVQTDIGVGELNTLLAGRTVSLGQLLDATVIAAGQGGLASLNANLVNAIAAQLGVSNLAVQLGSLADVPTGLFAQIVAPNGNAQPALNVGVSALQLIYSAIGVAVSQHAVDVSSLNVNLLGIASASVKAAVIEPPSIAIGGIGVKAYTAQVRTYVRVKTESGLLGGLLSPLVKLDLPIVIDAVTGQGTLIDMCTPALRLSTGEDRAKIQANASILRTCVGAVSSADLFSKTDVCSTSVQPMEMLSILGIMKMSTPIQINALPAGPYDLILAKGETQSTPVNPLAIGTLVSDLVSSLSNALFGGNGSGTPNSGDIGSLAQSIWDSTSSVCSADTTSCRASRLDQAKTTINSYAGQSGLLTGLLNGLSDLLGAVGGLLGGDGCSYTGLLGTTSNAGCVSLIKGTLSKNSSGLNGVLPNALTVLVGMLKPVLNAVGSSILTPLFQNVLGLNLGQLDVHLDDLNCSQNPQLVY